MTHRARWLVSLLLVMTLLTSCTGVNPFTDELLQPPRLTNEQKEIEEALLSSVPSAELTFKYPKSGEHRSAFIFQDIDGDGEEEALVFYVTAASESTFLSVLDRLPDGKWHSPCARAGPEANVEFISFANLTDPNRPDILVGWSDPASQRKKLGVYSFLGNRLANRFNDSSHPSYDSYLTANLDESPLSELILLSRDMDQSSWIHLFNFDGYGIHLTSYLPLSDYITDYAGIIAGRLSLTDSRTAVFIDEVLAEEILATEVFVMEKGNLMPIINFSLPTPADLSPEEKQSLVAEDEAPVESPTLYELTRRSTATSVCKDVNGDGVIEIPTGRVMPGYEDFDESERFYLTKYTRLQDNALVDVYSVAINRQGGYQIQFPPEWVGHVTVVNQMENNEWRFIEYNNLLATNPLEDWSSELMRIRVVSRKDYQDKSIENYTVLATRGSFTYYGYIPETSSGTFHVTMDQFKNQIFSLISS